MNLEYDSGNTIYKESCDPHHYILIHVFELIYIVISF